MKLVDWHRDQLSDVTEIDAGYKNTQNTRRYFKSVIGEHFKFNRPFMQYLKENPGLSLKKAAAYWKKNFSR